MDIVRKYAEAIAQELESGNPSHRVTLDQSKYWSNHTLLHLEAEGLPSVTIEFHAEDLRVIVSAHFPGLPMLDEPGCMRALAAALARLGVRFGPETQQARNQGSSEPASA